ncbi:MAG: GGDEF domain-containing protein [bacterium]|nr:GGDEF domain-containing protein [bacterium]
MKDRIEKHTHVEKDLQKKLVRIGEIVQSNERNAVKVSLINDILGEMTDKFLDIHYRALTDEMTGFVNRWFLNEFLKKTMKSSQRYGQDLSLAIMDIDHFKTVNDTFGHTAGDMVIKEIAVIITKNIRSSDVVSRYGGDEFIVIFPSTNLTDAKIVMNRIKLAVAEYEFRGGIKSGISFGIANLKKKHRLFEDLVKDADVKLYKAKKHRVDPNAGAKKSRLKKVVSQAKK